MIAAGGISIHAVDVSSGRPALGLAVRLLKVTDRGGEIIAAGCCGRTGLFDHPTVAGTGVTAGCYVAEFDVADFYALQGAAAPKPAFLDVVRYEFGVSDVAQHYHLPFKFTAWGFSLFRGGL
jgi:5-hydroxyisourate hydrolase-like protein (transthyretin family)